MSDKNNYHEWTCPETGNVLQFNADLVAGAPELAHISVGQSGHVVCADEKVLRELRDAIDMALERRHGGACVREVIAARCFEWSEWWAAINYAAARGAKREVTSYGTVHIELTREDAAAYVDMSKEEPHWFKQPFVMTIRFDTKEDEREAIEDTHAGRRHITFGWMCEGQRVFFKRVRS